MLRYLWNWIVKPVFFLVITIGGLAGAYNDIPAAWRDIREKGYVDRAFGIAVTAITFFWDNWAVMTACFLIVGLMFHLLILEPYMYARRKEEEFLEGGDEG